ncbi:MAG: hypothetical protein V5783_08740 [Pontiella sp.]
MKIILNVVLLLLLGAITACESNEFKNCGPMEADYYLSSTERESLVKKSQKGNADATYKLALNEIYFGQRSQALTWFQLACKLGYNREDSLYLSIFEQIEKDSVTGSESQPKSTDNL